MKVYCGSTAGKALEYMWNNNYGLTLTPKTWRYQYDAKWRYWTLDNGAYSSYLNGEEDKIVFVELKGEHLGVIITTKYNYPDTRYKR